MEKFDKSVILLVDDKPANLFALENMLAGEGKQIITAKSGKEALTTILNKEIDLIILDVHMPEMDGLEATRLIKNNPETANIPILILSAHAMPSYVAKAKSFEGCDDYDIKPVEIDRLIGKIEALLKK